MKYADVFQICQDSYGVQFVIPLKHGWKDAARRVPIDKLEIILTPTLKIARMHAEKNHEIIDVIGGEFGLHHIVLADRAGLDLVIEQNCYMGHNLNTEGFLEVHPIIVRYLQFLDDFSPTKKRL